MAAEIWHALKYYLTVGAAVIYKFVLVKVLDVKFANK